MSLAILEATFTDGLFLHIGSGDWQTHVHPEPSKDSSDLQVERDQHF